MPRRWRWLYGLLGAVWLVGCTPNDTAIAVSLANLAHTPATYEGRLVATEGVVHGLEDPRHYWIEDEDLNRVALLPEDQAADHVGEMVRVVGRFHREERGGRQLLISEIVAIGP